MFENKIKVRPIMHHKTAVQHMCVHPKIYDTVLRVSHTKPLQESRYDLGQFICNVDPPCDLLDRPRRTPGQMWFACRIIYTGATLTE